MSRWPAAKAGACSRRSSGLRPEDLSFGGYRSGSSGRVSPWLSSDRASAAIRRITVRLSAKPFFHASSSASHSRTWKAIASCSREGRSANFASACWSSGDILQTITRSFPGGLAEGGEGVEDGGDAGDAGAGEGASDGGGGDGLGGLHEVVADGADAVGEGYGPGEAAGAGGVELDEAEEDVLGGEVGGPGVVYTVSRAYRACSTLPAVICFPAMFSLAPSMGAIVYSAECLSGLWGRSSKIEEGTACFRDGLAAF
jgi:hypothetical protein